MTDASATDVLNLGCGDDQPAHWHNVDAAPACDPDEVVDLAETPWPWDDATWRRIRAAHVIEHVGDAEAFLRECERVLAPGGIVTVIVPVGVDARADPDHETEWTWRTPEFYTGKRHWDADVGLEVRDRRVAVWSHHPSAWARKWHHWKWNRLFRRYGPGPWCFGLPQTSGEFAVVFEKP